MWIVRFTLGVGLLALVILPVVTGFLPDLASHVLLMAIPVFAIVGLPLIFVCGVVFVGLRALLD